MVLDYLFEVTCYGWLIVVMVTSFRFAVEIDYDLTHWVNPYINDSWLDFMNIG